MIDIKTLSCCVNHCDRYASCHDASATSVVNKRQEASTAYRTKAKELDYLLITKQVVAVSPLGTPDPYESVLSGFGKVLAPVVGAFADMSSDVHLLTDLIASAQAADHCEYFRRASPRDQGHVPDPRPPGSRPHGTPRLGAPAHRPHGHTGAAPWGSTKASAQDDKAMDAHHYYHPPSGFSAGFAR